MRWCGVVNIKRGYGGVRVPDKKEFSSGAEIEAAGTPKELCLFLSQHTGAPANAVVKAGDLVKKGQMIAEAKGAVSASIHAPTSGKVKAVEPKYQPVLGRLVDAIVIEPDGKDEVHEGVVPRASSVDDISKEDLIKLAREAGLVGLGGAAFPVAVKLTPPSDKKIDTYLLNGIECEPYLTADERLMAEEPNEVVFGFRALMKGAGVGRGIVCIEDNKPEAISAMREAIRPFSELTLAVVPAMYPRGGEKQLIQVVLGREVPPPPGLPLDVGVIVSNVGTARALASAVLTGMPLIERIVTVTGEGIQKPSNFRALIGTPVSDLVERAGGFKGTAGKVIMGGPMMGTSLKDLDSWIIKGTSGIVVLSTDQVQDEPVQPCLRCGKCVEVCPMNLMPVWMAVSAEHGYLDDAEKYRVMDCCECGACTYECPSKRPLVQNIKLAKARIAARRRAQASRQ
jgi:electron transport complex protein RnfC